MPSSIHARERFRPSRCAELGIARIGHDSGAEPVASTVGGERRQEVAQPRANSAAGSTRRIRSASAMQGERKSSPDGS